MDKNSVPINLGTYVIFWCIDFNCFAFEVPEGGVLISFSSKMSFSSFEEANKI